MRDEMRDNGWDGMICDGMRDGIRYGMKMRYEG